MKSEAHEVQFFAIAEHPQNGEFDKKTTGVTDPTAKGAVGPGREDKENVFQ